jgi:nicotinate-nucleotide--dimethylbenzimidazole phosphoribosyltransferase
VAQAVAVLVPQALGVSVPLGDSEGERESLALGLRLGEGSGAALAIAVVQGAVACHSGMATFAEAGVATG